ncbi:hypothetical protein ABPG77_003399 [Micractinium sp. CCAP 211/92]
MLVPTTGAKPSVTANPQRDVGLGAGNAACAAACSPGSQERSPVKALPPKTPAPTLADAAPPQPLPGDGSPSSALTAALQQGAVGAAGVPLTLSLEPASADEGLLHDEVLLFTSPAAVLDPALLVHSPGSSLEAGHDLLSAAGAAAGAPPPSSSAQTVDSASPWEGPGGESGDGGDGDGEHTPRASAAVADLTSPSMDGFSLADLLQGPAPAPARAPSVPRSPASRPATFLQDLPSQQCLDGGSSASLAASPLRRPSLQLPGCSPLPSVLSGLREPAHLPGMVAPLPLPRPPPLPGQPVSCRGLQPGASALMRPSAAQPQPGLPPVAGGLPRPAGAALPLPAGLLLADHAMHAAHPLVQDDILTAEGVRRVVAATAQSSLVPQPSASGSGSGSSPDLLGAAQRVQQQDAAGKGVAVTVQAVSGISAAAAQAAFAAIQAGPGEGAAVGAADGAVRGDPQSSPHFSQLLALIRGSSHEFEAQGRVLRLRQYLRADVGPQVLDAVFEALEANTRVEALYCQNFEQGMRDAQLDRLARLLRRRRIWAVNVGENFGTTQAAWRRFCEALPHTAVGHLFVSEQNLAGSDLKGRMRDAIRANRRAAPPRDPEVIVHVGNMWWNPRLPSSQPHAPSPAVAAAVAAGAAAVVTVPAPAGPSRGADKGSCGSASAGGSAAVPGDAGSGPSSAADSAGTVVAPPPAQEAAEAAATAAETSAAAAQALFTAAAAMAGMPAPAPVLAPPLQAAGSSAAEDSKPPAQAPDRVQLTGGYSSRAAPKRRHDLIESEFELSGSPLAKRGPAALAFSAAAGVQAAEHAREVGAELKSEAAEKRDVAAAAAAAAASASWQAAAAPAAAGPQAAGGRPGRRASRPSAARLLQQQSEFSSDDEVDVGAVEDEEDDDSYLPFKSGMLIAADPYAAPKRASRRLHRRGAAAYQGHLPMDEDFVTFEAAEEPPSPPRGGAATRRSAQHGRPVAAALPPAPAGAPRRGVPPPAGGGPASATRGAASTKRAAPAGRSLRASSGRQSSGELKGKPSFAELVESGFMQPGAYRFTVGTQDIHAALEPDGTIVYGGVRYRAISKFALVVLRERNPSRQSCDGWKEVALHGEKLDVLRARFQSHQRKMAARKAGQAAQHA